MRDMSKCTYSSSLQTSICNQERAEVESGNWEEYHEAQEIFFFGIF